LTPLSPLEQSTIAARAANVYERASVLAPSDPAAAPSSDAGAGLQALKAWNNAFSPGDAEAFARRLTWDGLDWNRALRLASDVPLPASAHPSWTDWLDRFLESAAEVANDPRGGVLSELSARAPSEEGPFLELWIPSLRSGREALARHTASATAPNLSPGASDELDRRLVREITRWAELAMFEWFRETATPAAEENAGDTSHPAADDSVEAYRTFVLEMLDGGLARFFVAYPVLARQLAIIVARWVETTYEFLSRLAGDRPAIAHNSWRTIRHGDGARTGLSDPHEGRRRVIVLEFQSGLRLVYKPRDIGIESALNRFLSWTIDRGLEPQPCALRVLDRAGYGWVEFAHQGPFEAREDVLRYFRSSGASLCLAFALRARDLHMENIVATRRGPALVDAELFLQPISVATERYLDALRKESRMLAEESCLATGFVRMMNTGPDGEPYDVGGLCADGTGPRSMPHRVWTALGSSAIHFTEEQMYARPTPNASSSMACCSGPRTSPTRSSKDSRKPTDFAMPGVTTSSRRTVRCRGFAESWVPRDRAADRAWVLVQLLASPKYQRDGDGEHDRRRSPPRIQ
jgi:hypothetical protein